MFTRLVPDTIREIADHLHITDVLSITETCRHAESSLKTEDWWRARIRHDLNLDSRPNGIKWRTHYAGMYRGLRWSSLEDPDSTRIDIDPVKIQSYRNGTIGICRSGRVYTIPHDSSPCIPLDTTHTDFRDICGRDGDMYLFRKKSIYMPNDLIGIFLSRTMGEVPAAASKSSKIILDINGKLYHSRFYGIQLERIESEHRIAGICSGVCVDVTGNLLCIAGRSCSRLGPKDITELLFVTDVLFMSMIYIYTLNRSSSLELHVWDIKANRIVESICIFEGAIKASADIDNICVIDNGNNLWVGRRDTGDLNVFPNLKVFDVMCAPQHIWVKGYSI